MLKNVVAENLEPPCWHTLVSQVVLCFPGLVVLAYGPSLICTMVDGGGATLVDNDVLLTLS